MFRAFDHAFVVSTRRIVDCRIILSYRRSLVWSLVWSPALEMQRAMIDDLVYS